MTTFIRTRATVLWLIVTTLLSLYIPKCIGAVAETGNAKWSLKAGTRDNFEPTLVVTGHVRGVVAEEGYVRYKFRRCQAKLVVNKRWSLTRVAARGELLYKYNLHCNEPQHLCILTCAFSL